MEVRSVRSRLLALFALSALGVTGAPALAASAAETPSTWIVRLAPAVPVSAVDTLVNRYGGQVRFTYTTALRGYAVSLPSSTARRLSADPLVAAVTADQPYRINDVQSGAQYGLDRIDQRTGLSGSYTYNATGAGVRVYGLDTGILPTHNDFGGRASIGYDSVGDGRGGLDCNGHGTHTAGTMAGSVYGVAKQVTLVGVRVLDCEGSGSSAGIIAGVDWVARNHVKPAVANMSLGSQLGRDSAIDAAVNGLINSGVTTAVAAGNGYGNGLYAQNACDVSPANVPAALTVSATDRTDTKPVWANTGTCVDLFAPGVDTVSTYYTSNTATHTTSGTSMSSPHVAGAAALYLQTNPSATPAQVASFLVGQTTAGVVKSGGSGTPNKLLYVGGITAGGGGNAAPAASFTSSTSGLTATFTDTSTDSDGTIASRSWAFGDGTTGTGSPVSRSYATAGTYTVTLTVTDNGGATSSTSRSVTVGTTSDPDPATPNLTSGVARSATSGAKGTWQYYKVNVPTSGRNVALTITGPACGLLSCPADLDLFGRNGSKPTATTYNCTAGTSAATESCTITGAPAGWSYVGVYVYSGSNAAYTVKATVS
jgi:subtilisin family serine protease